MNIRKHTLAYRSISVYWSNLFLISLLEKECSGPAPPLNSQREPSGSFFHSCVKGVINTWGASVVPR